MNLNYKDVQFLLGCSRKEARKMIFQAMSKKERTKKDGSEMTPADLRVKHEVNYNLIGQNLNSFSDSIHGKKMIKLVVDSISSNGISDRMKRNLLSDMRCVLTVRLMGKYKTLLKILPEHMIKDLQCALERNKIYVINSKCKIPKHLKKYIEEEAK